MGEEEAVKTQLTMARTTSALLREAERKRKEETTASPGANHARKKNKTDDNVAGEEEEEEEEEDVARCNGLGEEEAACTANGSAHKGRRSSACENEVVRSAWTSGATRETGEGNEYEAKTRRNADDGCEGEEEEVRSAKKVKRRRRDENDASDCIVHAEGPPRRSSSTAAPSLPGKTDLLASLPEELLESILSLVDPRDLVNLRCVSKWLSRSGAVDTATKLKMGACVKELKFSSQASFDSFVEQLGFKSTSRHVTPLMVLESMHRMRKARDVSARIGLGSYHSALLMRGSSSSNDSCDATADACASLHMCGRGFHGQLGLGDHDDKRVPTPLHDNLRRRGEHLHRVVVANVANSDDNDSIVDNGGDNTHDDNGSGTPGDENDADAAQLVSPGAYLKVVTEDQEQVETDDPIVRVSCGGCHTTAVTVSGRLLTWGLASSGELGHGGWTPIECPSPRLVSSVLAHKVVSVAAGGNHTIAVTRGGAIWTCGRGRHGQLGHGHYHDVGPLQQVMALRGRNVIGAAAGATHSAAYAADGALYTWGSNSCGQLGHGPGHVVGFPWPRRVSDIAREHIFCVAAGGQHTLAVTSAGVMYAFGRNRHGALGLGDASNRYTPERVRVVPEWAEGNDDDQEAEERIAAAAAGADHSIVLTGLGKVYTCGHCNYGQLGHGDLTATTVFNEVWALSTDAGRGTFITAVAAGDHHSAAVDSKGHVWMWGRGEWGQLGYGATRSQWKPVRATMGTISTGEPTSDIVHK